MEVLRGCFPPALRRALEELPKSLDTTYERILLGIEIAKRGYAYCLLQFLAFSIRPLCVEELAEVLAVRVEDGNDTEYDCDWRPEDARQAVLSACSSLITIVNVDGSSVVHFSHFSVKEFLMSSRLANAGEHLSLYHILPHSAHLFISQASLSVLLNLGSDVVKDVAEKRPFTIYAARYWVDHAKFEGVLLGIQDLIRRLFDPDAPYFAIWVWIYDVDRPWKGLMPTMQPTEPEAKPLYYAALCGFHSLVKYLIVTHQMDVNARGGDHGTALNAALARGELEIARTLIQNGTNVNTVDSAGFSSLYRAAQSSHRAVVELLLEHQIDVNFHAGHVNPLHVVAQNGELFICWLLLKHGADVASKIQEGWTALHIASRYGHSGIVEKLLVHGADVNDQNKDLWTSLHLASTGHLDVVQTLVRHGAALDKTNADQETALHIASRFGNVEIACFLIEQGANTRSKDKGGHLPLDIASLHGYLDLVEIFEKIGMDVNIRNADYQTPLHLASGPRYLEVAHFLIEHGADVNCCDNRGCTLLHTAACNGHLDIVRLLLDHELSVQTRNGSNETPLILASFGGHLEVSRYLLEHHADVNSFSDGGWTPLHSASQNGHINVVQLLLDNGASVNAQKVDLCTPLHLASACGYLKVAELLIGWDARVDVQNGDGRTPLNLASGRGELEASRLLIKSGSNVNLQDNMGCTPSHAAARNGHLSLVELLLDSGADIDIQNKSGNTPFDLAQENRKLDVAGFLARLSGNLVALDIVGLAPSKAELQDIHPDEIVGQHIDDSPSSDNNSDETNSLHFASVNGLVDLARQLLDGGADVNERDELLQTPLDVASRQGELLIAKTLLIYGADVNSRDNIGWTPLHTAARCGHSDVVQLLLDNGTDVNCTAREGETALHIASGCGNLEIVRLNVVQM